MPSSSRRAFATRLARLEAATPAHLASGSEPMIVVVNGRNDGETREQAIHRECGPAGLPAVPRGCIPHFVITAAWAPGSMPDPPTIEHQPQQETET